MPSASWHPPVTGNAEAVEFIARDTQTSVDLVRTMYEEEVAQLSLEATFTGFIDVLAVQKVRRKIKSRRPK